MRLLVLTHEYPPVGGGGGRVAQDICAGLARRGHAILALTAHWGDLPRRETRQGVEILRLASGRRFPYKAGVPAMGGYVAAALPAGLSAIRGFHPEGIHVHFAVPAGAAAYALHRLTGLPYVLTAHLGDVPGGVPEKTGRWFRFVYPFTPPIWRAAARVVAVSEFTRRLALENYPREIEVIPNGVDLACLPPREPGGERPSRLVFAGRLVAQKNPLHLVRALAGLADLPWTCAIVGDGPLRPAVEAEIDRSGMRDRFTLTGWLDPEQVLGWFARSDVLCMPSLSEGLPVVGVQAVAMGLALAVSRVGGWIDLVDDGANGLLLPPQDTPTWQAGLRALLSDPARLLSMQAASRQRAARYDLNRVLDAYEALFADAFHKNVIRE